MASSTQVQPPHSKVDPSFYSAIGAKYETAFSHDQGLIEFIQEILAYLPSQATVLDLGCGTGKPVAVTLAQHGHNVIGVDSSDVMVGLSRKAVPAATFEVADMCEYSPPDNVKANAVLNILSLFALQREEIEAMVVKWAAWLSIGGHVGICTLPAEDCEPEARGKGYDSDGICARDLSFKFMGDFVKITLFTRFGWKTLLEKHGFEIMSTKTALYAPPAEAQSEDEPHLFIIARKVR